MRIVKFMKIQKIQKIEIIESAIITPVESFMSRLQFLAEEYTNSSQIRQNSLNYDEEKTLLNLKKKNVLKITFFILIPKKENLENYENCEIYEN